jgi:fructose-1,6-bisphosphatase/inositol monophosphatase family enzyme
MTDDRFHRRRDAFAEHGDPLGRALAMVAEGLDVVAALQADDAGGETVRRRGTEYKSWDAEVFRVDQEVEDAFRRRLAESGRPALLLSEEAGRVEIGGTEPEFVCVADPFDGSWLFKRGIPAFWYSSLAFYSPTFDPVCAVVGDVVAQSLSFASEAGVFRGRLVDDGLADVVRLNVADREPVTDLGKAGIASYAMKPAKFLFPLVDRYRAVLEPFKFFLPNGGPDGFTNVAAGRVDVYFAPGQPFVDVFSGTLIAERAGAIVTDFAGRPVRAHDDVETVLDVVASSNADLHEQVLALIAASIP